MVISLDDLGFYVAYDSPQARNSPVLLSDSFTQRHESFWQVKELRLFDPLAGQECSIGLSDSNSTSGHEFLARIYDDNASKECLQEILRTTVDAESKVRYLSAALIGIGIR